MLIILESSWTGYTILQINILIGIFLLLVQIYHKPMSNVQNISIFTLHNIYLDWYKAKLHKNIASDCIKQVHKWGIKYFHLE